MRSVALEAFGLALVLGISACRPFQWVVVPETTRAAPRSGVVHPKPQKGFGGVGRNSDGRLVIIADGDDEYGNRQQIYSTQTVAGGEFLPWSQEEPAVCDPGTRVITADKDGSLELLCFGFLKSEKRQLLRRYQTRPSGPWTLAQAISTDSSFAYEAPIAARNVDGRVEAFYPKFDGAGGVVWTHLWQATPGGTFTPAVALPTLPGFTVTTRNEGAVGRNASGKLELVVVSGQDLVRSLQNPTSAGGWSEWLPLTISGGTISVAAVQTVNGALEFYPQDANGIYRIVDGRIVDYHIGGPFTEYIAAPTANGLVMLLGRDRSGIISYNLQLASGPGKVFWQGWVALTGNAPKFCQGPFAGADADGRLEVFAQDCSDSGHMWRIWQEVGGDFHRAPK